MSEPAMPVSVVIPAYNESASITRLLGRLLDGPASDRFDVIVVCNGCSDDTADVARLFDRRVTVLETPVPSKTGALALGDTYARHFPRVYIDADVEIDAQGVRALGRALSGRGCLAAGPVRRLDRSRTSLIVRWYYDVWQLLPQVREGLFGRGVIALSEDGHRRVGELPAVMSDDLAYSEAFAEAERVVVADAEVVVRIPRTLSDLLRRRIRIITGNAQLDHQGLRTPQARTSLTTLRSLLRAHPGLALRLPVFVGVTVVANVRAARRVRAGDSSWLRDESSRQP